MDSLPIFLTLTGRRVIVVGSGEAAAAKVRLIEAAGGTVVADGEAMLAFVAIDDEAEAEAAATTLRARGLLVNVVDRPQLSDFTMGSIVDRSPVVVAISTGGASASLARALRGRLEALLPAGLGALAAAIRSARDAVSARHPRIADRRRLWEAALAPGAALDVLAAVDDPAAGVAAVIGGATPPVETRTVVVEVATGDPGDLTLNQLALLSRCDALRVEGAVAPAIIDRARRDAVRLADGDGGVDGLTIVLRRAI